MNAYPALKIPAAKAAGISAYRAIFRLSLAGRKYIAVYFKLNTPTPSHPAGARAQVLLGLLDRVIRRMENKGFNHKGHEGTQRTSGIRYIR
jgi:hypothetical protein